MHSHTGSRVICRETASLCPSGGGKDPAGKDRNRFNHHLCSQRVTISNLLWNQNHVPWIYLVHAFGPKKKKKVGEELKVGKPYSKGHWYDRYILMLCEMHSPECWFTSSYSLILLRCCGLIVFPLLRVALDKSVCQMQCNVRFHDRHSWGVLQVTVLGCERPPWHRDLCCFHAVNHLYFVKTLATSVMLHRVETDTACAAVTGRHAFPISSNKPMKGRQPALLRSFPFDV